MLVRVGHLYTGCTGGREKETFDAGGFPSSEGLQSFYFSSVVVKASKTLILSTVEKKKRKRKRKIGSETIGRAGKVEEGEAVAR